MLNYPEPPKSNYEPYRLDIETAVHRAREVRSETTRHFVAVIADVNEAMQFEREEHCRDSERMAKQEANLAKLESQKQFAEQQEEICGKIAKGEFTKYVVPPKGDGWGGDPEYYHNYTESQLAVRELVKVRDGLVGRLELAHGMIAGKDKEILRLNSSFTSVNNLLTEVKLESHHRLHELDLAKSENSKLRKKLRSLTRRKK